jgi:DNA polymerase V
MPDEATGWPLLAAPVSAGLPVPADDQVERRLSLDTHLIRNPETTFLMRVTGEALADAGLHNGDLLVMDRATPPLAGSVVLAIVDGTPVLTRLGRDAQGRLRVQAPGTDLSQLLDKVTMVGIARWVIHRLWPGRFSS